MLARTRHGHVELAVNHLVSTFVNVFVVGKEEQLIFMLGRETIDDIVALATLVTFNGVDRDVVQLRNAQAVDSSTHGSNLIAVREA